MNGLEALGTFGTANTKPKETPVTSKTARIPTGKTAGAKTNKTAITGTRNRTGNSTSNNAGKSASTGRDTSETAGTGAGNRTRKTASNAAGISAGSELFEALRLLKATRTTKLTLTVDEATADKFKALCDGYGSQADVFTLMTAVFHAQLIGSADDE